MRTEPGVEVGLSEEMAADLRAAREASEAARADASALRVLLATRSHQHDLARQDAQRLGAELAEAVRRNAALAQEVAAARERLAAVDTVLDAVAGNLRWRGLDRARFRAAIARAARSVPDAGPQAARHAVLLDGARRVLGLR